jgi:uncharacterized protein (DUF1330 family)
MNDATHIEPSDETLAALGGKADDGPFVALNLNRYRRRAQYPAGTPDADVSGREAYLRYGIVAFAAIMDTGGRILWAADAAEVVIGCGHDRYDEVVAVWYPSRKAFLGLEKYPGYREAFDLHRRASIEHASLLFFRAGSEPALGTPYGG